MEVSVSEFVEFVSKSGTPKLTLVKNIKSRPKYDPRKDYWKGLREAIAEFHEQGSIDPTILNNAISKHEIKHKGSLYKGRLTNYKRFLRNKEIEWQEPLRVLWKYQELNVKINPELNIGIDGIPHVIKLYLKNDKLTKKNADIMTYIMRETMHTKVPDGTRFCVLDVPDGKLYECATFDLKLMPLLKGEASSFIQIWNEID